MDHFDHISIPDGIQVPKEDSVKKEICKAVNYVLRNGATFEEKLESENIDFVQPGGKHNDYYTYLLEHQKMAQNKAMSKGSDVDSEPTEPHPFVFSNYRTDIGQKDLELMKATAHFCVINSETNYLEALRERYANDPRFAFLRFDHSLNSTLIDLINQYEQILSEEYGPIAAVDEPFKCTVLRRAFKRAEFQQFQDEIKEKLQSTMKKSRIRFSAYEWDKFELVETISFNDDDIEQLPPALDFENLKKTRLTKAVDIFRTEPAAAPQRRKKKQMNIRKAGETRLKREGTQEANNEPLIKCPITGRLIPESKFDSHLKILLSDPEYKEARDKYESKHRLTNLSTSDVYQNIKKLVSGHSANSAKRQRI
ncbi:unnamed protein product [Kluyveromyces dobzhanskii CBS 2104]|uniref:WGS project CCBQ000000000 data, contig MAT n=1 Tax=Kluyveromyces dobzhanskii CBS 2104 TaxID=1427455 RepID=A0A0A8L1S6_9SACH|nr:unnamed protein product [Kluyveromyces dobzhanskii CBS 2104]